MAVGHTGVVDPARSAHGGIGATAPPAAPADWLLEHRRLLEAQPKGRALDIASGRGRNAIYLAELGFEVDAVDIDPEALHYLRRLADDRGLPVRAIEADLTRASLPGGRYDVVIDFNYLDRALFRATAELLAPGGLLVFETFTREHVDVVGQRMNERYVLEPNELLRAFADLRVLHYREAILGGKSPRAVASLVARKA